MENGNRKDTGSDARGSEGLPSVNRVANQGRKKLTGFRAFPIFLGKQTERLGGIRETLNKATGMVA